MGELFDTGREMTKPYNSGKYFGEVSYEQLNQLTTDLTEEERKSPFSKYYYMPMGPLQPEHLEALEHGLLRPEDCRMPGEAGSLLLGPPGRDVENGYGVLPNGVGYAAIKIDQAGITDEMIKKYREEFAQEGNLFYKVWCPGSHLMHYVDGAVEDFGWGMLNMHFSGEEFEFRHLGIEKSEIPEKDPACINFLGIGARCTRLDQPEVGEEYLSMVCHTRLVEGGRELRVRYWYGMLFGGDGTYLYRIDPDRARTQKKMKQMMAHCMREYRNQYHHIKLFWENGRPA